MAKTNYKSIDQYHAAFSGEALERMQIIRRIVHEVVPDAEEIISYQIPCFKYQGYLMYYCAFPKHVSISHPFSPVFWEHFKDQLSGYKASKSVIQLPLNQPFPEQLIREIVSFRKEENESRKV